MNIEKLHNKKIDLFGTPYTIKIVDTLDDKEEGIFRYGTTNHTNYTITVARTACGDIQNNDQLEIIFLHELVHAICATGAYLSYNDDEQFVEWMARCIHKVIKSGLFK